MDLIFAWRSLLFIPGNDEAKLGKAARSGADVIIIDLEDGVSFDGKDLARQMIREAAATLGLSGIDVIVRINASWRSAVKDLESALFPHVRAIMVPKTSNASQLQTLSEIMGEIESERDLPIGQVGLLPLIESPLALAEINSIVSAPRVLGIALGSEDFALEVGVPPTPELLDLPCRMIALSARGSGVMAFATPLSLALYRDEEAILLAAKRAVSFGCTGALCIHPLQARIANQTFRPSVEAIEQAKAIVERWAVATRNGEAVFAIDGRMIDAPVAKRAHALLKQLGIE